MVKTKMVNSLHGCLQTSSSQPVLAWFVIKWALRKCPACQESNLIAHVAICLPDVLTSGQQALLFSWSRRIFTLVSDKQE